MTYATLFLLVALPCFCPPEPDDPALVVLAETGAERDGLPVLREHEDADEIVAALSRGYAGRLVRLYRDVQVYLGDELGREIEPAYLLLSSNQGGFPRYGFHLGDEPKPGVPYVDLHRRGTASGRFGAMDQIFPHELAHVLLHLLVGELPAGGANQVHAIGVRTDRGIAFDEGFAEHCQVLAVDDEDAPPATKALAADHRLRVRAIEDVERYVRELGAIWAPLGPMRLGFPLWYSGAEQTLRYHAVKENRFARAPDLPGRLGTTNDAWAVWRAESVLLGDDDDPPKTFGRMLATEGVVSALFVRLMTDEALRASKPDDEFYARFGRATADVSPFANVYLKLFHVLHERRPADALAVVEGWGEVFPDEAAVVEAAADEVFLGRELRRAPELWLANPDFRVGTSLFDQFRALPRTHTFDLNAASIADLLGVPDVDRPLAEAILGHAPFAALSDLDAVPGVDEALAARFDAMAREMERLHSATHDEDVEDLSLATILGAYAVRLLGWLAGAALLGAFLMRRVRDLAVWRAVLDGVAAAVLAVVVGWATHALPVVTPMLAVVLFLGTPAAFLHRRRAPEKRETARVFASWALAALPAAILVTTWF